MKKILIAAIAFFSVLACSKTEYVKQSVKDSIAVAPEESVIDAAGGTVKVIVTSSGEWTLKGREDYSAWITPSSTSGIDGDYVTFDVKNNAASENKVAEFVFTCGKASDTFKLTAKGFVPDVLSLTSDSNIVLNENAGEITVTVSSSLHYRKIMNALSEGADWLTYLATKETAEGAEIHFSYGALKGLKDRNAEIVISGEGVEPVRVQIIQQAKRVLNVAKPAYTVEMAGGKFDVAVETNVEYKVEISAEGSGWLTLGEQKEGSVSFNAAALASGKRSATVTFTQTDAKDGVTPLSAVITVSQLNSIIKWAANMKGNRLFPKWDGPGHGIGVVESFTIEMLVKFDNFNKAAGQIFTLLGVEDEFLLRLGDTGNALNHLQLATRNGKFNLDYDFEANRWYHIAVVCEAPMNFDFYIDGEWQSSQSFAGYNYTFDLSPFWSYEPNGSRCFWVGYSYDTDRDLFGQITEIRLWKRALYEDEINAENHFYTVAPDSEGLFSYWKFTKGEGTYVDDATSNGNKLYGETNVRRQGSENRGDAGIEWVEAALPDK